MIQYGPGGLQAAHTLGAALNGPVTYTEVPSLSGQTLTLLVAGPQLTVIPSGATATTTTTTPSGPTTTTTTTIPPDVYTNTQLEPWNPYPCTLGPTSQVAPTSSTTSTTS